MGLATTLTYVFDECEHPELQAVRITVGTGSMRVIGTHSRLVRLADGLAEQENRQALVEEQAGALVADVDGDGALDEGACVSTPEAKPEARVKAPPAGEERPEDVVRVNLYRRWALLAAVTRKVQVVKRGRKARELDLENPDAWPWQESSLEGLGWDRPGPVVDLPADLFTSWELHAQRVNPGTFGPPLTGAVKKKTGLISVI